MRRFPILPGSPSYGPVASKLQLGFGALVLVLVGREVPSPPSLAAEVADTAEEVSVRLYAARFSRGGDYRPCAPVLGEQEVPLRWRCGEGPERDHSERLAFSLTPSAVPVSDEHRRALRFFAPSSIRPRRRAFEELRGASARSAGDSLLDRALRSLVEAYQRFPASPALQSDLAAAHLLKATEEHAAEHLEQALILTEDLWSRLLNGELPPSVARDVAFNRALLLETLALRHEATASWERFLELEPDSPWADEARQRWTALQSPMQGIAPPCKLDQAQLQEWPSELGVRARAFPRRALDCAAFLWLPAWANSVVGDQGRQAALHLQAVQTVAQELSDLGDHLLTATLRAMESQLSAPSSDLLQALFAFGKGYTEYQEDRETAPASLLQAEELLRGQALPLAELARVYRAAFVAPDEKAAWPILAEPFSSAGDSPLLAAYVAWIQGLICDRAVKPGLALGYYTEAEHLYGQLGDRTSVVAVKALAAATKAGLGKHREAWGDHAAALRLGLGLDDPSDQLRLYVGLADHFGYRGHPAVAALFQDEVVRWSANGYPSERFGAHLWRAVWRGEQGLSGQAREDVQRALEIYYRSPGQISAVARASLEIVSACLTPRSQLAEAEAKLDHALAILGGQLESHLELVALVERAALRRALGNARGALADLDRAIGVSRRVRDGVDPRDWRLAMSQPQDLYRMRAALEWEGRGDAAGAFLAAERWRLQDLELSQDGKAAEAIPLPEAASRLPDHVAVLAFLSLEDKILAWYLRRDVHELRVVDLSRQRVAQMLRELRGETGDWRAAAEELHRELVRPAGKLLEPSDTLVIVPDGLLFALPWAALRAPQTGRYLVQDHGVLVSSSVSRFVAAQGPEPGHAGDLTRVVALASPAFRKDLFPEFGPIVGTRSEAHRLQKLHPPTLLLEGEQATASALAAAVVGAELVAISAHAVFDHQDPLRSALLLAPEAGDDDGLLTAEQLHGVDLSACRLAVLAGCETAGVAMVTGEGLAGLVRAVLMAGARSALATLWAVNDTATDRLLTSFYGHLFAGASPPRALQLAQQEQIQDQPDSTRSPTWAAFQLYGVLGD